MTASILSAPKFCEGQRVWFLSKEGIIKSYCPESGSWFYLVDMLMGLEP